MCDVPVCACVLRLLCAVLVCCAAPVCCACVLCLCAVLVCCACVLRMIRTLLLGYGSAGYSDSDKADTASTPSSKGSSQTDSTLDFKARIFLFFFFVVACLPLCFLYQCVFVLHTD